MPDFRRLALGLLACFAAALLTLVPMRAAMAQNFVANQLENFLSTDTMEVEIEGLSGALTGNIRIESVTVSDPQGAFLTARDLAMDWSPFALVRSNLSIENLTAGQIVLERLPEGQPESTDDSGGFSLPSITADIENLAIEEFVLGEAIAGQRARLRAQASLELADEPTSLSVNADIERLDQPGQIALNVVYAPDQNQLTVEINASEPAGGIVATLLDIPGRPPVELTVNGSGPLSAFMANGSLTIGGEAAATLTARVDGLDEGRQVALSLNVAAQQYLPEQYQRFVEGGANLDAQVLIADNGIYRIDQAVLSSDTVSLTARGALDLAGGGNDLTVSLAARDGGPLEYSFGTQPGGGAISVDNLQATLQGSLADAQLNATASVASASFGEYAASDVEAELSSQGFNVRTQRGPFSLQANAASVAAPEGVADRMLEGPVRIALDGALTESGLQIDSSEVRTETASASAEGSAALDFSVFDLGLDAQFQTTALSAALAPIAGEELAISANVARTPDAALSLQNLSVSGAGLSVEGEARLADGTVSADISGRLAEASDVNAALSGAAEFSLTAEGPVEQPEVALTIDANELSINGRELAGLTVRAQGALDPASPSGRLEVSGTLDGQPLTGSAQLETLDNGERRITDLSIRQGPNSITGDLRLSEAFLPIGTLDIAIEDLGPLAALGGLDAAGDLDGTVSLEVTADNTPTATLDLAANEVSVAGSTLSGAEIDLTVADYLGMPQPVGTVSAAAVDAAGVAVRDLQVSLVEEGEATRIEVSADANGVPVELGGNVSFDQAATQIGLSRLTAEIPDAAVSLREAASVRIADGTTTLSGLTLDVGDGTVQLSGSAGDQLDLTLSLQAVPAAVVNPFVDGLDASGTVSGEVRVTGTPADPNVTFSISVDQLAVAQSRSGDVPPIDGTLAGRYAGGTLTLETARLDLGTGSLTASGSVGDEYDLDVRLNAVPVALANGFVDGLDASGTISGTASVTGPRTDPSATFDIEGRDITAEEIAAAGIAPLTLDLSGSYANGTLDLGKADVSVGDGSLTASGTIGESLDIQLRANELPVGLANGFVPDLDAEGTISGSASASGSLSDPTATFDLTGTGITTRQIAQSGTAPLDLRLAGRYADGTADLETAVVNVGDGSLTASGQIGQTLDVAVDVNNIPVGLANGFVDGLGAEGRISGTAQASGTLSDPTATFDLAGTGITADGIEESGIGPLEITASGRFADGTLALETVRANVGDASLTASGTIGEQLDLQLSLDQLPVGLVNGYLPDLGAEGTISGEATATGSLADPQAEFTLNGTGITTRQIAQSGVAPLSLDVTGSFADGTATIQTADVTVGDGSLSASGTVGETLDLDLTLDQLPVGLANGFVEGLDAEGTISGSATATGSLADPQAEFTFTGTGITTEQIARSGVAPLSLDVTGSFADGTATIDTAEVSVGGGSLSASGTVGETLDLDLTLDQLPVGLANGFVEGLNAEGTISGSATATGSLADPRAEFTLTGSGITTRQIAQSGVAPLSLDVAGSFADGTATIETADVSVGDGSLSASGTVGETLDLDLTLDQLPVGLANGFVDGLGAQGTVSGTASATGSLSNPDARFDIDLADVSVAQGRAAGAPAIDGTAQGRYADGQLSLTEANVSVGGGMIDISGTAGPNALDLTAEISDLPASIAGSAVSGLAPQGTINGTVRATGSPSAPLVTYDISGTGLSVQQTRDAGVGALSVDTTGQYTGDRVTTETTVTGADGIQLTANGAVNLSGTPTLDIALDGTAPLSAANRILAEGGRSIEGTVAVDARVTGPISQPNVVGSVSTAGARLVDTNYNIALDNITTTIALNGQSASIESFTAQLSSGGSLTIDGTVGLDGDLPADLSIRLVDGRYNDGELIAARLGADLTLTGPLLGQPLLAGEINAEEINVLVPENLPSSLAQINVEHRNAAPAVYEQQDEINPDRNAGANPGGGIAFDLTFNAPSRVFVRGRGLDVELGGTVDITGPSASPSIVGGFELQRGRFVILGRRLDFDRGRLSFTGALVPTLDLLARSDTGDATVYVAVTGPANDPSFTFSSSPALPQDEVLARLIFGQGTSNLSPLQIAQLAEAAASLAGVGGSTGLLENLRAQLGVDDLDIRTTADGQTAVGVGRYLNENTYLGVDSTGRVSIDLDLGAGLKARGAVDAEGGGEVGVFYEGEF
jgi:translocation and assembly module TamB